MTAGVGLVSDLHPLLLRVVQGAVSRDAESTLGDLWREAIDRVGLADPNALRRTALEVSRQRPYLRQASVVRSTASTSTGNSLI